MRIGDFFARSQTGTQRGNKPGTRGFTLGALIMIMAVMAILMTVAVQSVTFQMRREKEEELIFRGKQHIESIRLFRARFGRFPLSIEELHKANPKVIRKKWVDPITGKADWQPVFLGQEGLPVLPGQPGQPGGPRPTPTPTGTPSPFGQPQTPQGGPVVGVRSSSCDESIKIFDGRTRYCDWKFFFNPQRPNPGGGPGPGPIPTRPGPVPTRRR